MIVTVHVVAGGVIGELVGNPAAAFLLGIISHFILDSIPHFDNLDNECFSPRQIAFTAADFMISFSLLFGVIKLPLNQTIFSSVFFWGRLAVSFRIYLTMSLSGKRDSSRRNLGRGITNFMRISIMASPGR